MTIHKMNTPTTILQRVYRQNLSLLTDLYQLTMAYGYWKTDRAEEEAVFHLFYRKNPFGGACAVAAGLATAIDFLQNFRFEASDCAYLATLKGQQGRPLFEPAFLQFLQDTPFTCSISGVPEGTVVFPHEPLLRVEGPLWQAQLIETALLNIINFQTLIATKAARVVHAAAGDTVLEFGLRRAQGVDGGLSASRAAYVGGCDATSNVLAGQVYGIPVRGTHAHSWVMSFEQESEAFASYAAAMPHNAVFLVDTYDTIEGVKKAIAVARAQDDTDFQFSGIRLDSGDLAALSIEARRLLDEAGFTDTKIVASNDLNETRIASLKAEGARIDVWGVGTQLATAYDQPALGGVYKLAAVRASKSAPWQYKMKLSNQEVKVSNPGILQVRRYFEDGRPVGDMIYHALDAGKDDYIKAFHGGLTTKVSAYTGKDLLVPIFEQGRQVYKTPSLAEVRAHALASYRCFASLSTSNYVTGLSASLYQYKKALMAELRAEVQK